MRVGLATMQQQVAPELAALASRGHIELREAELDVHIICRRHPLLTWGTQAYCARPQSQEMETVAEYSSAGCTTFVQSLVGSLPRASAVGGLFP